MTTPRTVLLESISRLTHVEEERRSYSQLHSQVPDQDVKRSPRSQVELSPATEATSARLLARRRGLLNSGWLEDQPTPTCWANFAIFPGTVTGSWWLEVWDLYVSLMIILLCYYEPYTFALYRAGEEPGSFVAMNRVLALTFTVDMVFQFFIAWPRSEDSLHKDLWESNPRVLSRHYLGLGGSEVSGRGGWFWFDLLAVLPCWFASFMANDNMANPLLMLRILRIFQSTRLHRLTKLQEFVHARTGYQAVFFEFAKFLFITTLTCHWMACLWVMVEGKITRGIISYNTDEETWLSALIATKGDTCRPDAKHDPLCTYLLAYYWATMTLTSVGYGDITPQNRAEYFICIICMTAVGYIWAYIVGTIVSILSSMDPENREFKHNFAQLNNLMSRRGLPSDLKVRMRNYMYETRHFGIVKSQRDLVERYLSHGLQREVASQSVEVTCIMKGVFWIEDLDDEAVLDIVRALEPRAFGTSELISMREAMIVMQKGIAGIKGRVLARGDVWGQTDILLDTPGLMDSALPRTISYVEILRLSKRSLVEVCRDYPRVDRRLRRAQIRSAVSRAFIQAADKIKRSKKAGRSRIVGERKGSGASAAVMDDPLTSFVNPGIKASLLAREAGKDVRCDLKDLKDLLLQVLKNQAYLEERIDGLSEQVNYIETVNRTKDPKQNDRASASKSEPTSRTSSTADLAAPSRPRMLTQWASSAFSPRKNRLAVDKDEACQGSPAAQSEGKEAATTKASELQDGHEQTPKTNGSSASLQSSSST